jgi:hypothetical protein
MLDRLRRLDVVEGDRLVLVFFGSKVISSALSCLAFSVMSNSLIPSFGQSSRLCPTSSHSEQYFGFFSFSFSSFVVDFGVGGFGDGGIGLPTA